jgi:isopenicillin N synthase-like dioxygenase
MSKPLFTITTVDFSAYLENPDSTDAQKVVEEIKHACKTSGFFQIVNHGIPQALQREVLEAATKLFTLPQSEKLKLRSANGRGYEMIGTQVLEPGTNPDLKEVISLLCSLCSQI